MPMNFVQFKQLVADDTVAARGTATLEPAVYDKNKKPSANYVFETRRIVRHDAQCVLIDSVQSQVNRMEEAPSDATP